MGTSLSQQRPSETAAKTDASRSEESPVPSSERVDRSAVIGVGLAKTSTWSLRFLVIGIASAAVLWLLSRIWVGVLPVMLALLFSSVLSPLVVWGRRRGVPSALASAVVVLGSLALISGVLTLVVRPMVAQATELGEKASGGISELRDWLGGPPFNIASDRIDAAAEKVMRQLESSAEGIAAGVFSGVTAVTSGLITLLLVVILSFLFLKDGAKFLPWLRRSAGRGLGTHLTEVLARVWESLGQYIRVQAVVSFVDGALIGVGLLILGVPLALPLAVLTFFAGFIPIVGAVVAGGLAALVALVAEGPTTAVFVLLLVLLVQQIESNVLQPFLQGQSLRLHPAVVLLSVTAGGTLFGITGAFLAVPVAAIVATGLRYADEQVALRAGEIQADDVDTLTDEGVRAVKGGERAARWFRQRRHRSSQDDARQLL